ncbi:MAG: hypothetical protein NVSMB51_03860 [Solirubrobacteraceae bacterium]
MDGVQLATVPPDLDERFFALRRELGVGTFGINVMRLAAGQRGRIHRHARQEEVYCGLDGILTLVVERQEFELERLQAVRVAPQLRRQLINRGAAPLLLLALGGAEPHEGRDGEAFARWEDVAGAPPQEIPLPDDVPTSG